MRSWVVFILGALLLVGCMRGPNAKQTLRIARADAGIDVGAALVDMAHDHIVASYEARDECDLACTERYKQAEIATVAAQSALRLARIGLRSVEASGVPQVLGCALDAVNTALRAAESLDLVGKSEALQRAVSAWEGFALSLPKVSCGGGG